MWSIPKSVNNSEFENFVQPKRLVLSNTPSATLHHNKCPVYDTKMSKDTPVKEFRALWNTP